MSRETAKAPYTRQSGDPTEGFISDTDPQVSVDVIYDDMGDKLSKSQGGAVAGPVRLDGELTVPGGAVGSYLRNVDGAGVVGWDTVTPADTTYVGDLSSSPDPARWYTWVITPAMNGVNNMKVSDGTSWYDVAAGGGSGGTPTTSGTLTITTAGATFSPRVWLRSGATGTVEWQDSTGTILAVGLEPTINFGTAASRTVRMIASNADDVETINFGFDSNDDAGRYNIGSAYNHPFQLITAVSGLTNFPRLKNFCAASRYTNGVNRLSGVLDCTNLAYLEHIECYQAQLTNVVLTGCVSLVRLCLESNRINNGTLNLNPVRSNLRDLRAAECGGVNFAALSGPLSALYHFCVRDQLVTGVPSAANFPALEEMWIWGTQQTGTLTVPSRVTSLIAYAPNSFTAVVVENPASVVSGQHFDFSNVATLAAVTMAANHRFTGILLNGCALPQAQVDAVIAAVDAWGTSNGTLNLTGGTNGAPSASSSAAVSALRGRNWTVTYNGSIPVPPDITTTSLFSMTSGVAFTQTLTATGSTPITYAVTAGTLPAGLSLSSAGVLSGTPSAAGSYSFTVTATNTAGTDSQAYSGTVAAAATPPDITTTTLSAMSVGVAFSQTLAATGTTPITYAVTAGTLPAGLTLSSAGVLSGTPTTAGAYSFTVTATNTAGTDPQAYTGSVVAAAGGPGGELLWEDLFERADCTGLANVGNGWSSLGTAHDANIAAGKLVHTGGEYGRLGNPATSTLPADVYVEIEFDRTDIGDTNYWGIFGRWIDVSTDGVAIFFGGMSIDVVTVQTAGGHDTNRVETTAVNERPATWVGGSGWASTLTKTLGMHCHGTTIDVYMDGVLTYTGVQPLNNVANGQVGFNGVGGKSLRRLTVRLG